MPEQLSRSGDRDVVTVTSIDKRRVVVQLETGPTREYNGEVVFRILARVKLCTLLQLEFDVALQMNGTR